MPGPGVQLREFRQMVGEGEAPALHLIALRAPRGIDGLENLPERGPAIARLGRPVGAADHRLAVGRQEHGQRPAALLAQRMERGHVDVVDIRALLAVDFDVDEQFVHETSRFCVLERLVRHHVAPVAGGVADGEQDRAVAPLGFGQSLRAPRAPMHRVPGVLQKIGRGLLRQGDCGRLPSLSRSRSRQPLQAASAAFSIALNRRESRVQRTSAPSCSPAASRQTWALLSSWCTFSRSTTVMPRVSLLPVSIATR